MAYREWAAADFASGPEGDEARQRHVERAHEHYRWVFYCWHYILGPGAIEDTPSAQDHQRIAERERKKHGWTLDSLEDAHFRWKTAPLARERFLAFAPDLAADASPRGKFAAAVAAPWRFDPPPTVERDYPLTYSDAAGRLTMLQEACDAVCAKHPATAGMTRAFYAGLIASASADVAADAKATAAGPGGPDLAPSGPEPEPSANGTLAPAEPRPGDAQAGEDTSDPNPF